jgi:hypothetical protein
LNDVVSKVLGLRIVLSVAGVLAATGFAAVAGYGARCRARSVRR